MRSRCRLREASHGPIRNWLKNRSGKWGRLRVAPPPPTLHRPDFAANRPVRTTSSVIPLLSCSLTALRTSALNSDSNHSYVGVRFRTEAYTELHQLQVLHVDAEPRNILYDAISGTLMVIDFERAEFRGRQPLGSISPNGQGRKRSAV